MSKIGIKPVELPSAVTVEITADLVTVKGPKGELGVTLPKGIKVIQENGSLLVERENDDRQNRANHGLIRSLIANNVQGVAEGYKKTLKLVGTGYRVSSKGAGLSVTVGFSHPVDIDPVEGIKLSIEGNDTIHIEGVDKQLVGQVAANVRGIRPPEPYKGKGIRYEDELVRTKPGKTATS
jgi:large subunit ribosomal protein L6